MLCGATFLRTAVISVIPSHARKCSGMENATPGKTSMGGSYMWDTGGCMIAMVQSVSVRGYRGLI